MEQERVAVADKVEVRGLTMTIFILKAMRGSEQVSAWGPALCGTGLSWARRTSRAGLVGRAQLGGSSTRKRSWGGT